jgi:hypothetical protein
MFSWLLGDQSSDSVDALASSTGPQLCLLALSPDFLALHNAGSGTAVAVRVDPERSSIRIVNRTDAPFNLAPGESWTFVIEDLGQWTESGWQVTVTWQGQEEPVCVPLPPGGL